jgi:16S rRNA (adenine1518-N6/adenine1519-N6)-dimethyltransferase
MVILLQKEVVDRIVANDKKESILSISIKAYGEPKKIGVVNRGSFFPAPNVDSAIIAIENISKKFFTGSGETEKQIDEDKFFNVLKAGFAHKRKVLISNLAEAEIAPKEKIEKIFETIGLEKNIRAEDLTPEDWRKITEGLSN